MNSARQLMAGSALFAEADAAIIDQFLSRAQPIRFDPGDIPVAEATVANRILMITSGELKLSVELQAPGEELKLLRATPGTFLGLVCFFDAEVSQPYTATAITDVDALVWDVKDWHALAQAHPAFGYQLARRVGSELVQRMSTWINDVLNTVSWGV